MKKQTIISLLVLLFSASISANTDNITFGVEERYEFSSIVWKLAGAEEFNECLVPVYVEAVEDYFKDYMNHPLMEYCKELRVKQSIGRSAVSSASSYIEIVDGGVRIRSSYDINTLRIADDRWTHESFTRYVTLLDSFYREAQFHKFFESQNYVYSEAEKYFEKLVLSYIPNVQWFESFFDTKPNTYHVYLGIMNGPHNYAVSTENDYDACLLFGCCFSYKEKDKVALYNKATSTIVAHEIVHNYANPLVANYVEAFDSITERMYPYVKYELNKIACDRKSIVPEWFTRLVTLMCEKDNGYDESRIKSHIERDSINGFVWQGAAFAFMDNFYQNRDKYPTIESFMPEVIHFLDTVSSNMEQYVDVSFEVPRVISVSPDTNAVYHYADIDTFVVEIVFSERMEYGIAFGLLAEDAEAATKVLSDECAKHDINWMFNDLVRWEENQTVMQIRILKQVLIDSKCTGIRLTNGYQSIMGVHLEEMFLNYNFK